MGDLPRRRVPDVVKVTANLTVRNADGQTSATVRSDRPGQSWTVSRWCRSSACSAASVGAGRRRGCGREPTAGRSTATRRRRRRAGRRPAGGRPPSGRRGRRPGQRPPAVVPSRIPSSGGGVTQRSANRRGRSSSGPPGRRRRWRRRRRRPRPGPGVPLRRRVQGVRQRLGPCSSHGARVTTSLGYARSRTSTSIPAVRWELWSWAGNTWTHPVGTSPPSTPRVRTSLARSSGAGACAAAASRRPVPRPPCRARAGPAGPRTA